MESIKSLMPKEQLNAYCEGAEEYILAEGTTLNSSGSLLYVRMPNRTCIRIAYVKAESDEVIEVNGRFLSPSEAAFTTILDAGVEVPEGAQTELCRIHPAGTQILLFHQKTTLKSFRHNERKLKECLDLPEEADGYGHSNLSLYITLKFNEWSYSSRYTGWGIHPRHWALQDTLFRMPGGKAFFWGI